jgi:hypothetical protein
MTTRRFSLPTPTEDPGPPILFEVEVPGPPGEELRVEQFSIPRRMNGALIMDLAVAEGVESQGWRQAAAFGAALLDMLGDEYPRFIEATAQAGWTAVDIRSAFYWMVGEASQRPTTPSGDAESSPDGAGESSTDGSSSTPVDA